MIESNDGMKTKLTSFEGRPTNGTRNPFSDRVFFVEVDCYRLRSLEYETHLMQSNKKTPDLQNGRSGETNRWPAVDRKLGKSRNGRPHTTNKETFFLLKKKLTDNEQKKKEEKSNIHTVYYLADFWNNPQKKTVSREIKEPHGLPQSHKKKRKSIEIRTTLIVESFITGGQ